MKFRMTWAALIKAVYEVDPLKCPKCGGTMKVIGFVERYQADVIQKILRHCGLWNDAPARPPLWIFRFLTFPDSRFSKGGRRFQHNPRLVGGAVWLENACAQ